MSIAQIVVSAIGTSSVGLLAWFFFGSRQAHSASVQGGVQQVAITVKGGYVPNLIKVQQGVPLRLVFDRQESGDCTSRVVFPDFALSKSLAAYGTTAVELLPAEAGQFEFACGMNMIHGTLVVEPPNGNGHAPDAAAALSAASQMKTHPRGGERGRGRAGAPGPGRNGGCRGRRPQGRDPRPVQARGGRRGANGAGPHRGDGFVLLRLVDPGRPHQPLVPTRCHHPGHGLHGLADLPHRVVGASAPERRHEQPDHDRGLRRVRLQVHPSPRSQVRWDGPTTI